MTWQIEFLEEATNDLKKLDHSSQIQVLKGIRKVSQNPLPNFQGGYGKPLGNKSVYKLEKTETTMKIIVISARTDEQAYKEAYKCREKYTL